MAIHRTRGDEHVRITTASTSHAEDIGARQRRYLYSMAVRSLCFIGAVVAGPGLGLYWLCWILIPGAVVLPYVAVVIANAAAARTEADQLGPIRLGRRELDSGSSEQPR